MFILLPVICLSVLGLVRFDVKASPTIIEVPGDYPTIQEAINAASPGDTVSVSPGTYYENLYINKNLTLVGANTETTTINGAGGWYAIWINSSSVTITGFTIVNATIGIYVYESSRCVISQNNVTTSHTNITQERGIWLYASNNSLVSDNIVYNVGWCGIVLCGHSSEDTIALNTVEDCGQGIAVSGEGSLIYHNNFVDNQNQTEMIDSFHNSWNSTNEGNYWSDYLTKYPNATEIDHTGIGNTPYVIDANNTDYYPLMKPFVPVHDITATDVVPCKTVVGQGYSIKINITGADLGTYTETFNITAYANTAAIETQAVTLASGASTTITFTWNTSGFAYGNYTISASVTLAQGETNSWIGPFTYGPVRVTIPGDASGDGVVDAQDFYILERAWGTTTGQPGYDPRADFNGDGVVDAQDFYILEVHWGMSVP
jgi:parallel beta-helix repeat protein